MFFNSSSALFSFLAYQRNREACKKYEALHQRGQKMEEFLSKYESMKKEELDTKHKLETSIVSLLEHISKYMLYDDDDDDDDDDKEDEEEEEDSRRADERTKSTRQRDIDDSSASSIIFSFTYFLSSLFRFFSFMLFFLFFFRFLSSFCPTWQNLLGGNA